MTLKLKTQIDEDQAHLLSYQKYYAPKVLNPKTHSRLVLNLPFYAEQANIPEHFVYNSALDILNKKERDYIANLHKQPKQGVSGAVYEDNINCIEKMYAMCGVLLRNFIDAKFITLQDLVSDIKEGNEPTSRLVCIPNFSLPQDEGGDVASWEIPHVFSWLFNHHTRGRQAVLHIHDIDLVEQQYGSMLRNHIENHFINF